ncbi:MAG: glycosyltransferase family 4 protein [Campylobacteraceae bacterium]|jgi:glycosyltransferase involved in cell wall biosynthesis|nr:glycosyltransferase family 4 protein [Campylobacteraceae bacterium]MBT4707446.1 glycosyltransferase family 4 protein [Campylobacteraceae bacterium]MBT5324381.1 glycosyltransferase family 4 protein [Campylobacteraceae bacterium]MBT6107752.1 glycosyltransferase family 4 protein [Campylobacteraceae bacterium]
MKNILFIIQGYDVPSSRVRILNLIPKLKDKGYRITCTEYPKKTSDKIQLFASIKKYDIVYLQKKLPNALDKFFIRLLSKKLLFDLDDAIYYKHESSKKKRSLSNTKKFNRIAKSADFITVGNEILFKYVSALNNHIEIIPSTVETNDIAVRDYNIKNEKFVVGWIGGNINHNQLKLLENVFERLSKELSLEVRMITGKPVNMENVNVNFIPWSLETQEIEIAKFDVGLMPLPDSPHAQGKCAFKAIQYMASGVVPIVSDVGINSCVVSHNVSGLVAKDTEQFYEHIKYLYQNKDKMKDMGEIARKRAVEYFSIDIAVNKLDKLFQSI